MPKLPLTNWGFVRYGVDFAESIESTTGYAGAWDALVGYELTYKSNQTRVNGVIETLGTIAATRNACYAYRTDEDGYVYGFSTTEILMDTAFAAEVAFYPNTVAGYWIAEFDREFPIYSYKVYQNPAFFMQFLAAVMGGTDVDGIIFAFVDVAQYLENAKMDMISIAVPSRIDHPHYVESYYLLATRIA